MRYLFKLHENETPGWIEISAFILSTSCQVQRTNGILEGMICPEVGFGNFDFH